jgi:hypothetical protein
VLLTQHSMGGSEYLSGAVTHRGRHLDARGRKRGVRDVLEKDLITILNIGFPEAASRQFVNKSNCTAALGTRSPLLFTFRLRGCVSEKPSFRGLLKPFKRCSRAPVYKLRLQLPLG